MIVRCLVGGCGWSKEGDFAAHLFRDAEIHRMGWHQWVKPGRVHRIDFEPEGVETIAPTGRHAELRHPRPHMG